MQLGAFFVGKLTEVADVSPLRIGVEPRLSVPLDEKSEGTLLLFKKGGHHIVIALRF